jgi:hypothetical protein
MEQLTIKHPAIGWPVSIETTNYQHAQDFLVS